MSDITGNFKRIHKICRKSVQQKCFTRRPPAIDFDDTSLFSKQWTNHGV